MSWARRIKDALRGDAGAGEAPAGEATRQPGDSPARPAGGPAERPGSVLAALMAEIARESEGRLQTADIDPEGHMYDCGYVDSLSSVTLIGWIESQYGIAIEDTELVGRLDTLAKLAAFIERARSHE